MSIVPGTHHQQPRTAPSVFDTILLRDNAIDSHARVATLAYAMSLEAEAARLRAGAGNGASPQIAYLMWRARILRSNTRLEDTLALASLLDLATESAQARQLACPPVIASRS
ncbi:hypothetical protein [Nocardia altamirensis]|uniref:hypothetical protein n=1 Tax=Nocardia altamirensis TaxID=472158 RepID=UPI0008404CE3|nr:hypothetical protein [Nocardia altamirensis]